MAILEFFKSIDTLVIGRRTYDFVLEMLRSGLPWAYADKRCVVMTHRPVEGRNGERAFAGEPAALLQQLEAEGARHIYVDGGAVIRGFLAAHLLDHLTVSVVPVLLGAGFPFIRRSCARVGAHFREREVLQEWTRPTALPRPTLKRLRTEGDVCALRASRRLRFRESAGPRIGLEPVQCPRPPQRGRHRLSRSLVRATATRPVPSRRLGSGNKRR